MEAISLTNGDILQELFHRNRLTEAEIGRNAVHRAMINRLVSCQTPNLRISSLEAIADFFENTVDQLLGKHPLEAN